MRGASVWFAWVSMRPLGIVMVGFGVWCCVVYCLEGGGGWVVF